MFLKELVSLLAVVKLYLYDLAEEENLKLTGRIPKNHDVKKQYWIMNSKF